jgi:DNA-binding NtrC family response regulator
VELNLPPLRERKEDIPGFVEIYRKFFNKKYQTNIQEVTEDTKSILLDYDWPGNIRELRQVIERCVLFSQDSKIDREVLLAQGMTKKEEIKMQKLPELSKQYREAKMDFDSLYFTNALQEVDYNITELAKMSGMNRAYIYQKIKELGLELH